MSTPISITTDPRFLLSRKLITSGSPSNAIDILADLLKGCREKFGETSLDSALCQYEYGNALFRSAVQMLEDEDGDDNNNGDDQEDDERKPAAKSDGERQREIMAAAAEKRFAPEANGENSSNKRAKIEVASKSEHQDDEEKDNIDETDSQDEEDDDVALAQEMIETALGILLTHAESDKTTITTEQKEWAQSQIPRFQTCLGDVYAFQKAHGNAVDAYIRALSYREEKWKEMKESKGSFSIEQLQCRRFYIEACALVAEALLACPEGEDVVCEEGDGEPVILAKAAERVDFAHSWFGVAREELDDFLCQMAKTVDAKVDLGSEKKDICLLVEMVAGVGMAFDGLKKKAAD